MKWCPQPLCFPEVACSARHIRLGGHSLSSKMTYEQLLSLVCSLLLCTASPFYRSMVRCTIVELLKMHCRRYHGLPSVASSLVLSDDVVLSSTKEWIEDNSLSSTLHACSVYLYLYPLRIYQTLHS